MLKEMFWLSTGALVDICTGLHRSYPASRTSSAIRDQVFWCK
jgi:hypothetical protein